jgi:hypothetical protein
MSQSTEADQSPLTPKPRCTAGRIVVGHDQAWLAGLTFSLNRIGRRHKGSDNLVLAAKPVGNLNKRLIGVGPSWPRTGQADRLAGKGMLTSPGLGHPFPEDEGPSKLAAASGSFLAI